MDNFLKFLIEKILIGWCGCQLLWIHESWVQEISWLASHGQFHGRLDTSGHLCISHRCCLAHQLGMSDLCQSGLIQVLEAVSTSAKRFFLNSRTPICARFGHGVCGLLEFSSRCAFGRMLARREDGEKHIWTNCYRIHLECIHRFMKFRNHF